MREYEKELYSFFDAKYQDVLEGIREKREITDESSEKIKKALEELRQQLGENK